ncbi:MAG: cadherin repeat domain-containing protein [Nitrospirae bacterium]|nr:cadherin repeat domain-containing protein [Nitrospirota bacterium]
MGRLSLTFLVALLIIFCAVACERQESKKADSSSADQKSGLVLPVSQQQAMKKMDGMTFVPRIARLRLTPQQPRKGDELSVYAEAESGKEGAVAFRYAWKLNDEMTREVEGPIFRGPFKKGDRVEVEVIPVAGAVKGVSLRQFALIGNTPPVAKANLVNANTTLTGYTAYIQAEDPDGDQLSYSLLKGPDGMKIDSDTGRISLDLQGLTSGTYDVAVSVKDSDGAEAVVSIPFTVEVGKRNSETQSGQ